MTVLEKIVEKKMSDLMAQHAHRLYIYTETQCDFISSVENEQNNLIVLLEEFIETSLLKYCNARVRIVYESGEKLLVLEWREKGQIYRNVVLF